MSGRDQFPLPLLVRVVPRWELPAEQPRVQLYELTAPFVFVSLKFGRIVVPARFVHDFASVPRLGALVGLDNDDPDLLYPSVPHDWLYHTGGEAGDRTITRQECDEVFAEAMLALGVGKRKAARCYAAVRVGGSGRWPTRWRWEHPAPVLRREFT